jgi:large subunit ribosomal protein L10
VIFTVPREAPRTEKVEKVGWLAGLFKDSATTILADYTGLNVEAMTELRVQCREAGIELRIVKNTLSRLAADQADLSDLKDIQQGPTAYAFSADLVAPAKVLGDFAKKFPLLKIKGGVLEGSVIGPEKVKTLAGLPSREVLLGMVAGTFQAPIVALASVLNANIRGFAQVLAAVRDKKEAA